MINLLHEQRWRDPISKKYGQQESPRRLKRLHVVKNKKKPSYHRFCILLGCIVQ
jgi:hypothetical protein